MYIRTVKNAVVAGALAVDTPAEAYFFAMNSGRRLGGRS